MEKKEEKVISQNPEPEYKNNRICCLEVKKWTSIVGWIGLVFVLCGGVAGTVGAFAFGFNIFELEQDSDLMTPGGAFEFCKLLWIFTFLGLLMHVVLLAGNAMDQRIFFMFWFSVTWALLIITTVTVAESVEPFSCEKAWKFVVYWLTTGFALYVVHRRYNELSAWDRKVFELEKDMEDSVTTA